MQLQPNQFRIPIKPQFKKWLIKRHKAEPIKVHEDSTIGQRIMSILLDKREKVNGISKINNIKDQLTETITVELSDVMMKRSPRIGKLTQLNTFFEKDFKDDLYLWVQCAVTYGINEYTATRNFCEHFDFQEGEYTHDAAQRAWLRYKNDESTRDKKKRTTVTK